jgi:hypothetical protein
MPSHPLSVKTGSQKIYSQKYTHLAFFQAPEAIKGEHRIRVLPLKKHQRTMHHKQGKFTARMMKMMKGGGAKKMMRQMEAMQSQKGKSRF